MKFFKYLSELFLHLLRLILILCFLAVLLFIVQWRVKHLYNVSVGEDSFPDNEFSLLLDDTSTSEDSENQAPIEEKQQVEIVVPENAKVEDIADVLLNLKLIQDKATFIQQTKDLNAYPYFTAGIFYVDEDTKVADIIDAMTRDEKEKASILHEITLPGQATPSQVADILLALGLIQDKNAFINEVKTMGAEGKFTSGVHQVQGPIKTRDLITALMQPPNKNESTQ